MRGGESLSQVWCRSAPRRALVELTPKCLSLGATTLPWHNHAQRAPSTTNIPYPALCSICSRVRVGRLHVRANGTGARRRSTALCVLAHIRHLSFVRCTSPRSVVLKNATRRAQRVCARSHQLINISEEAFIGRPKPPSRFLGCASVHVCGCEGSCPLTARRHRVASRSR